MQNQVVVEVDVKVDVVGGWVGGIRGSDYSLTCFAEKENSLKANEAATRVQ